MMRERVGIALLASLMVACGPPDDQDTGSIRDSDVRAARDELPAALLEALDSGNAAYRRGEYQAALESYQRAVEVDDDVAAGWFGVYMAHLALGNPEAADSAMARAQDLAPGASLIHPEDTTP